MGMIFCRGCGKEIHELAQNCPHCGAPQQSSPTLSNPSERSSLGLSIASLVFGIVCWLAIADDSGWDRETIVGCGIFSLAGIVLGAVSLNTQNDGKGMAIAGVVLSAIALIAFIGLFLQAN